MPLWEKLSVVLLAFGVVGSVHPWYSRLSIETC